MAGSKPSQIFIHLPFQFPMKIPPLSPPHAEASIRFGFFAFLLFCAVNWPLGAQETAPAPVAVPVEAPTPAVPELPPAPVDSANPAAVSTPPVERSIYVPYEDLEAVFEKDGRGVFLPYREFLDLWNQLNLQKKDDTEKPPADGVLAAATYVATVQGDEDQVLAIDATLQVESFKEKGWAVVPMIQSGLNIAEADTGEATLHLGAKGYELILPKKGSYEIKLKLYAKVQRSSGQHQVVLNLPKAGVSKFEATLPEQGWQFDIRPGAAYSSEDLPDGQTKFAFFFGETEQFNLSWQKQGEETKLTPLLFVESDLTANVIPGALQSQATLNFRILRAGVDQFLVTVPAGQEVLSVSGDNIKEWDVAEQGGIQRLTVRLHAPAKAAYALGITLEEALDTLPTEFDVPKVIAENVVRQRGSVTLRNHGELEIETAASDGLTQQSLGAETQAAGEITTFGRFRYLTTPFSMTLSVKKAEPIVEVESWTRFTVDPDASRFLTRFDYEVKRVGIFDTRLTIPAAFEGIEATGPSVEDFTEETAADGTRTLTVKFSNRAEGRFSFQVTGRLVRANAEDDATVPVFSPLDVERHEGKVGLEIHTSLDPNTKDSGDLRQQDVSLLGVATQVQEPQQQEQAPAPATGIPGNGPLQIGFRYRGEAAPAVIGFKLKEPQVNAEVFTSIEVREQLIRYRWTIDYRVLYAGVDTFVFSLPESIADDLRVDGTLIKEIDKDHTPEAAPEGDADAADTVATPLPAGHKLWAVILRDKRMGSYELTLSLDRPLSEAEITGSAPTPAPEGESSEAAKGQHFKIGLPEIALVDVFRETGQVAVVKDDNLEILNANATALEPIDPKELRGGLAREGVFLAYKYRRHPLALDLEVSRNEFLAVPQAVVTYAALTSVVSSDEAITTEVVYWVKNNAKQFFSVSLPEGGKMVSDVYVNGTPQQPMRRADEDVVLIRLPVGGEQTGQEFPVRFVFEVPSPEPGESLGAFGSVRVLPAELTDAEVLQSHTTLFLPNEYVYRSFKSAMRLPVERRGWTRFRNAFDWILPSLGPQILPGMRENWMPPPALPASAQSGFDIQIPKEGQKYELHRLDAPAEIKVGYRSQAFAWFWEALFCLAAFGGGLWMLLRPLRWRLGYFAGAGLVPLIIAGAVSPAAASFWQAISLGAFLAAIVWLIVGAFRSAKCCGGWAARCCRGWLAKRKAKPEDKPTEGDA